MHVIAEALKMRPAASPRMRVAAALFSVLLLAGCLQAPADDETPTTTTTTTTPSGTPTSPATTPVTGTRPNVVFEEECVPFDVAVTEGADGFRPGEWARLRASLRNCTSEAMHVTLPYCAKHDAFEARLVVDGETWFLQNERAVRELPEEACEAFQRLIEPNETFDLDLGWRGTVARTCFEKDGCPFGDWVEPGSYDVHVVLASAEGGRWEDDVTLRFLAPAQPPYVQEGILVLLFEETYPQRERIEVRMRNDGDKTYVHSEVYAACGMRFYDADGYPFLIPPGTHCDIANTDTIAPGETVTLFTWELTRCTVDHWGCAESAPLPPGTYHVSGSFHEDGERHWENPETRTGATFRII